MRLDVYNRLASIFIIAAVGISIAAYSSWTVYLAEHKSIEAEFQHDMEELALALRRELILSSEIVHGLRALFDASDEVRVDEFRITADAVLHRHSKIVALEWIPRVLDGQRDRFEQLGRALYGDFELTQFDSKLGLERADRRDVYFPVFFAEPSASNVSAIGVDLGSDPIRLEAIERTILHNHTEVASPIKLEQRHQEYGFLIMLPVYEGMPVSRESRTEKLQGLVVGVFSFESLFSSVLNKMRQEQVSLHLLDNLSQPIEIYREGTNYVAPLSTFHVDLSIFEHQKWVLEGNASEGYFSARETLLPWIVLMLGVILVLGGTGYGVLLLRRSSLIEIQVEQRTRELNEAKSKLEALTLLDGLTGVANRRAFDRRLEQEWRRAQRDAKPLALLMIDVDLFKNYNDRYGHQAGDVCLQAVAEVLTAQVQRAKDFVARYGGEEFAVILPEDKTPERMAEQLRFNVEAMRVPYVNHAVTISIGYSVVIPDENGSLDQLIRQSDQALYRAKNNGRNCCSGVGITKKITAIHLGN